MARILAQLLVAAALSLSLPLAPAAAQTSGDGAITGTVVDEHGAALAGVSVAASPVGSASVVQSSTDSAGAYRLSLAPGDYNVAFNLLGPQNLNYESVVFGGPGPAPNASCVVCGGQTVTVTAGATTGNVNARLPAAAFTRSGYVRPLSGKTIRVGHGTLKFKFGCHEYPDGCKGFARLRLGRSAISTPIRVVQFAASANEVRILRFKLPASLTARLRSARNHQLTANVELNTPRSRTVTRFKIAG
ncbi:MAG: hypothetical protein NVSMB51_03970 [Solirubrobacteraceae bacterium]